MDRLRDQRSPTDPVLAEAAKLARSVSLPEPPLGLQQRIRAALLSRRRASGAWTLRPAVVVVVLIALMAISAAAALRAWRRAADRAVGGRVAPPSPPRIPALAPPSSAPPAAAAVRQPAEVAVRPVLAERNPAVSHKTAATRSREPVAAATPLADDPPRSAFPAKPTTLPTPSRAAAPNPDEAILVLDATRALHHDHDAKRAAKLLAEYLRRFPDGDLLEESLALAIEARSARNDAGAALLANEYLGRFPTGRFREEALRAQSRFAKRNILNRSSH